MGKIRGLNHPRLTNDLDIHELIKQAPGLLVLMLRDGWQRHLKGMRIEVLGRQFAMKQLLIKFKKINLRSFIGFKYCIIIYFFEKNI